MDEVFAWKGESFEKHLDSMLNLWDSSFKPVYLPTLSRVLGLDHGRVNILVEKAIILHDVGKLYEKYQEFLLGRSKLNLIDYRHELVSAYYSHGKVLERPMEDVDYCLMASIALHHEPIIMGQIARFHERYLTITDILRRFRKTSANGKIIMVRDGVKIIEHFLKTRLNMEVELPIEVKVEPDIIDALRDMLLMVSAKGSATYKAKMRIQTSVLLFTLCILDSWAANLARGVEDDGGTFITRHAKLAEVPLAWIS